MKKWHIKYNETFAINRVEVVEAENLNDALVVFQMKREDVADIVSIEEAKDDEGKDVENETV